jgi:hypothetical protein
MNYQESVQNYKQRMTATEQLTIQKQNLSPSPRESQGLQ